MGEPLAGVGGHDDNGRMTRSRRTQDAIILCTAIGAVGAILGGVGLLAEPVSWAVFLVGLGAAALMSLLLRLMLVAPFASLRSLDIAGAIIAARGLQGTILLCVIVSWAPVLVAIVVATVVELAHGPWYVSSIIVAVATSLLTMIRGASRAVMAARIAGKPSPRPLTPMVFES